MAKLTGAFIPDTTANYEINQFLDIRNRCYYHIISKLQSEHQPAECLTYHSDMETSFIFDKELILNLFKEIDETGVACNALRVYYAADPAKNGSTTVVLVGAYYVKDDNEEVINVTNVFSGNPKHAAIEYPGGGLRNVGIPSDLDIRNDNLNPGNITIL